MTEPHWRAILHALDEPLDRDRDWRAWPDGWEAPLDFDHEASTVRCRRLAALLADRFGAEVPVWRDQQDSSLFASLGLPGRITVYLSNFGNLATYRPYGSVPRLEPVLVEAGYLLVPGPVADSPYDGPNHGADTAGWTWFTRFFDYL